jgi:F-box and leucine-rich repeat protein GRR1
LLQLFQSLCSTSSSGNTSALELIDLSGVRDVTNSVLHRIVDCCGSTLRSLHLNECNQITDGGLSYLLAHAPNLQCLEVRSLFKIRDGLVGGSQLQTLNVGGCEKLTTQSLLATLSSCSSLTALNLQGLNGVLVDEAIDCIASNLAPSLRRLNLANACRNVSELAMNRLASNVSSQLEALSLAYYLKLGEATLTAFQRFGSIKKLVRGRGGDENLITIDD